jgi:hypothetical protein
VMMGNEGDQMSVRFSDSSATVSGARRRCTDQGGSGSGVAKGRG